MPMMEWLIPPTTNIPCDVRKVKWPGEDASGKQGETDEFHQSEGLRDEAALRLAHRKLMALAVRGCQDSAPMDGDTSNCLFVMLNNEMGQEPIPDEFTSGIQYRIIESRLAHFGIAANKYVILFVSMLCENPGKCTLWASTLAKLSKGKESELTLSDLCFAFPDGFPTEDSYQKAWDDQKMDDGGNFVDTVEAYS